MIPKSNLFFSLCLLFIVLGCSNTKKNKKKALLLFKEATVLLSEQKSQEALLKYNQAIDLDSTLINAYLNRGNCHQMLKNDTKATDDFTYFIDNTKQATYLTNAYYARGVSYHNLKQNDLAIQDYSSAIKQNPKFVQALYNRAKEYLLKGDSALCCNDLNACLQMGFKPAKLDIEQLCK